ncbi:MAG: efflux transporter outer membrane subunit [Rhodanobacter sp.]|jgi:multidrug efflux system outer membrane protein|nr:efflux transporter outer membrane subunit [Rhodanobacter sp.]
MTAIVRPLVAFAVVLGIAACSVPPKPALPDLRNAAPLAGLPTHGDGHWPDSLWWSRYHDDQLDQLEQAALAGNPSLAVARTRFDTALHSVEIARAALGTSITLNATAQRQRLSETGLIPPQFLGFTWYNQGDLGIQFQYDFDFWGKTRAGIVAALDEAHAQAAERNTAALMMTTAVADTYFGWQADQARLALARESVRALQDYRALVAKRVERGIDPPDLLIGADAQIAAVRELEAGYAGSLPIREAALAALLGQSPAQLPALTVKPLPAVDGALPDNVGIDLLARRADIAASRWRVEAAMQRVTQAHAEFYPDISIGAMAGLSSIDFNKMFTAGSRVFDVGPALHLPLFSLHRLRAAYGVSQAQLAAAAAQYNDTVVGAAREVATQALSLQQIAARRQQREQQVTAMSALRDTAAARARRGVADERSVLTAQAQVLQQKDAAATLDAQAVSTQIALIKALGGGYDARVTDADVPDVADDDKKSPSD